MSVRSTTRMLRRKLNELHQRHDPERLARQRVDWGLTIAFMQLRDGACPVGPEDREGQAAYARDCLEGVVQRSPDLATVLDEQTRNTIAESWAAA